MGWCESAGFVSCYLKRDLKAAPKKQKQTRAGRVVRGNREHDPSNPIRQPSNGKAENYRVESRDIQQLFPRSHWPGRGGGTGRHAGVGHLDYAMP